MAITNNNSQATLKTECRSDFNIDGLESFLREDRINFYKNFLHDLNSQARTVKTFCQIIDSRNELSSESHEYLKFVEEAGERLAQLSSVMNKFLEQELYEVSIAKINISEALTSALFKVEELIKDKQVKFSFEKLDKTKEFLADSFLLEGVLFEVIKNAIVHHEGSEQVSIDIKLESSEQETLIHIIDLGTSLSLALASKSLEYLTKLDDWNSSSGLGSGLAISKQILVRMGGDIYINQYHFAPVGNCVTIKLRTN